MRELSPRQREILEFLKTYSASRGMAPSVAEIAAHFGIAPSTASGHLRALRSKRRLTRTSRARSIVLTERDPADPVLRVPVYWRLASPEPDDNRAYREGVVCVHRSQAGNLPGGRLFALRIPDESLSRLGIFRNDVAVFAPADELPPRLGDVAAVFHDGEALVRGYFPHVSGGMVTLRAADPETPALELPPGEIKVLGVLISLQRHYPR